MIPSNVMRTTIALFLFSVLMGAGQKASAFTPGACRQDAEKLCPDLEDKSITPCLKEHEVNLSTACRVNLAEARERVRQVKDACQPDIQKFCADVPEGQGRIRRCLKDHETELTSACQEQIATAKKKLHIDDSSAAPAASPK